MAAGNRQIRGRTTDRGHRRSESIQIVAGLLPDGIGLGTETANEGGMPGEVNYRRHNPVYGNYADERAAALVEAGVVPCIMGAWGFHLEEMAVQTMKGRQRYIVTAGERIR